MFKTIFSGHNKIWEDTKILGGHCPGVTPWLHACVRRMVAIRMILVFGHVVSNACLYICFRNKRFTIIRLLQTVEQALKEKTPVVVVGGSGQWANILASLHSMQPSEIDEAVIEKMLIGTVTNRH